MEPAAKKSKHQCLKCQQVFNRVERLTNHNKHCAVCDETFCGIKYYNHHQRVRHLVGQSKCIRCQQTFPTLRDLSLHQQNPVNKDCQLPVHDHQPYQGQNANTLEENISENEDKCDSIIENLTRYKSEEEEVNKDLFSLIQTLEDEVKKKFDQLNDGLKKQRDNKIKNLREVKDTWNSFGEIKDDIETLIKTCTTDIIINQ